MGGGASFSLLHMMGEAYKVGQLAGEVLDPMHAFYLATLAGARALKLDDRIGNLAPGKAIITAQPSKAVVVEMGELPPSGKWVRLEAPLNKLIAGRTAPAPLSDGCAQRDIRVEIATERR